MTVKEFADKFNKSANEETIKSVIKHNYLSFARKCNMCERIIKATYYNTFEDGTTKFHIDSTAKYMLFNLSIVDAYTDIDIDFSKSVEEYDLLAKNNLINNIKELLPELELGELYSVLEMKEKDTIQNEYEPHAFISGQVERFGTLLGVSLSPILEKMTDVIENLDAEKVAAALNKVDKNKVIKLFK